MAAYPQNEKDLSQGQVFFEFLRNSIRVPAVFL